MANNPRKRARRRAQGHTVEESPWFSQKLALMSPTPIQRRDWDRNRVTVWQQWADVPMAQRPDGNKYAPVAAVAIDWDNHMGPKNLTLQSIRDYRKIAGPGFDACARRLKGYLNAEKTTDAEEEQEESDLAELEESSLS